MRIKIEGSEAAYRQIERAIVKAIREGELKEGDRLPSETTLAEDLGLSRMTVNKAFTLLAQRGLITRVRGKGSFVTPRKLNQGFFRVTSFNRAISEMGMTPSTKVIETTVLPADKAVAKALSLPAGSPVILVKRLRMADGVPLMLETRYLNETYCRPILNEDLSTGSIHDILIKKLDLPLTRVKQTLEVKRASRWEAELLGVREGDCCFYMVRTTFTEETPMTWVHYVYRSDRYRFEANFNPMEESVGG
jgi:GntR family transcriptional regulator